MVVVVKDVMAIDETVEISLFFDLCRQQFCCSRNEREFWFGRVETGGEVGFVGESGDGDAVAVEVTTWVLVNNYAGRCAWMDWTGPG